MPFRQLLSGIGSEAEQINFLNLLLDNLPLAVFAKDIDDGMKIVSWNKTAESMLGVSAKEATGRTVFDLFPKELAEKYHTDDLQAAKRNQKTFLPERRTYNSKSGEFSHVRVWKIPVATEQRKHLLCIVQDTTEVHKAETETREQARRLMSISNNVSGLLYQFKMDPQGRFSFPYISKRASEFLGVSSESIRNDAQAIIGLIHKDDMAGFEQSLEKTIFELSPWRWEGRFWAHGQRLRWFRGASEPAKQEDGTIIWDGMLIDITPQKEAEEQVRKQEAQLANTSRLVALGEMAGGVAHEINTPLNSILFSAEQIQASLKENSFNKNELLELSSLISETSQRIAKIVKGLKVFARDGSKDQIEEADLDSVIDQTLSLCSQRLAQNGIKLEYVGPQNKVKILARSVQLGQVLLNLINNSFDAVIGTEWPWIKIDVKESNYAVEIAVTDSGTGVTKEVRAKLFQPFFTTKGPGKGTGIGLSISQGIISAHNGRLYLDEQSPNTKFIIELPKVDKRT